MRNIRAVVVLLSGALTLLISACVNVKAPEKVEIGNNSRVVDARHVPETHNHDECRQELTNAYSEIERLQRKMDGLEKDKRELKRERDDYKDKYKKLKKSNDD